MGTVVTFGKFLAHRFLRDHGHLSPASQDRALKVLAKAHKLASERAAQARQEITYPIPECTIGAAPAWPEDAPEYGPPR